MTGVQTCALPISALYARQRSATGFVPEGAVNLNEVRVSNPIGLETRTGRRPAMGADAALRSGVGQVFPGDATTWKTAVKELDSALATDPTTISNNIVRHVSTTLSRAPFNVDDLTTCATLLPLHFSAIIIHKYSIQTKPLLSRCATASSSAGTTPRVRRSPLRSHCVTKTLKTAFQTQKKPKRIYYFSLEFLMGKRCTLPHPVCPRCPLTSSSSQSRQRAAQP